MLPILNGKHVFGMTSQQTTKDTSLSYLSPLISFILKQNDHMINERKEALKTNANNGYIKQSTGSVNNGPYLLIICSACKNAQRIYELVSGLLDQYTRQIQPRRFKYGSSTFSNPKAILLQGGDGQDYLYNIPLSNGCDILISSTPYCILRMIATNKTNLEI